MNPFDVDTEPASAPRRPGEPDELEARAEARWIMLVRIAKTLAWIAGVLAFAALVYIVVVIRAGQVESASRGKDTNTTADRIEACTTPGRSCYERSQRQLTDAVVDVNRVTVLAAACASRPVQQTVSEIQRCVLRGLNSSEATVPRPSGLPSAVSPSPATSPSSSPTFSPRPSATPSSTPPQAGPSSAPTSAPASPRPTPRSPSTSPTPTPSLLCVMSPLLDICL